jgi:hypothetical protein
MICLAAFWPSVEGLFAIAMETPQYYFDAIRACD